MSVIIRKWPTLILFGMLVIIGACSKKPIAVIVHPPLDPGIRSGLDQFKATITSHPILPMVTALVGPCYGTSTCL